MFFALMSAMLSGFGSNISKFCLSTLNGYQLLLIESSVILSILFFKQSSWNILSLTKREKSILLAGSLLHGFAAIASHLCLGQLSVEEFSLIGRTQTIFSIFIGIVFFRDKLNFSESIAILMALCGIFACFSTNIDLGKKAGLFFGFSYCFLFSIRTAIIKIEKIKIPMLMFYGNIVSFMISTTFIFSSQEYIDIQSVYRPAIYIIFSTILTQFFGVYLYYYSIQTTKFSIASSVRSLSPVFSLLISFCFFDGEWDRQKLYGWILMALSMAIFISRSLYKNLDLAKVKALGRNN